jgi:phosphoribosylformylglycinamidine synthase
MAQFSSAIDGLRDACLALGTPITGGNVSLYNETRGEGIYPTPVVGIVGILDDIALAVPSDFVSAGDTVLLLRPPKAPNNEDEINRFGSSEYARTIIGKIWGAPPHLDLASEAALHRCLKQLTAEKTLRSARDVSDGGLAVALAEACFGNSIGVRAELPVFDGRPIQCSLFAEHASNVVLSCEPEKTERVRAIAASHGLEVVALGSTVNQRFEIVLEGKLILADEVRALRKIWRGALQEMLAVAV